MLEVRIWNQTSNFRCLIVIRKGKRGINDVWKKIVGGIVIGCKILKIVDEIVGCKILEIVDEI